MVKEREKSAALRGVEIGKRMETVCMNCGAKMTLLPSAAHGYMRTTGYHAGRISKTKFCRKLCWRQWQAARFDRHVANPETLALPQDYDEFLTKDELPCLVGGCEWTGKNLSIHMNHAHGITKDEFKALGGFNVTTGVVSASCYERLAANPNARMPIDQMRKLIEKARQAANPKKLRGKSRLEALEHRQKAYAARKAMASA
jgi:hypothetical protein